MRTPLLFLYFLTHCFTSHAQSTASKQVSIIEVEAQQLDTIKKVWVYLPKSYHTTQKRYPVIYMHDAQNLFDKETSYAGEWGIDEHFDQISSGTIVVGIEHGNKKRVDELTPWPDRNNNGGKGDAYLDFIATTLKPIIDEQYRTKSEKKHTAIGGSSLGGLISFYALMKHKDTFSKGIIFSPSFWWSEEIYNMALRHDFKGQKLYMTTGSKEGGNMVPDLKRMQLLLLSKGLSKKALHVSIALGHDHNEKFWSEAFPKAYAWLH